VKVGKAENGSRVTLEVGQTLVLSLASNPTTGYQWEITELNQAILQETDHEYQADQPALAGSGGKEIWRFQAQASGTTTLSLGYRRPWEENVEPIETFSLEVVVQ
jgi:inhibitor of cysteine peptidase